jgi:MarR family transcriptional regulator for hemolysin
LRSNDAQDRAAKNACGLAEMVSWLTNYPSTMPDSFFKFDRNLGFVVSDVSRLLRREFERRVRGLGLTRAQWMMLSYLARQPGASQSELAESLQQEKITVSRQASRLERSGWIERADQGDDRRAYRLRLTPKAEQMIARLFALGGQLQTDALAGLSARQRDALINSLLAVRANLMALDTRGAP